MGLIMRTTVMLLAVVILPSAIAAQSISLDHVSGLNNQGQIPTGQPIEYFFRLTSPDWLAAAEGIANGYVLYSPDGATWVPHIFSDTTVVPFPPPGETTIDVHYYGNWINEYSGIQIWDGGPFVNVMTRTQGTSSDQTCGHVIGFAAFSIYTEGLLPGFDTIAYSIRVDSFLTGSVGKSVCLDSTYFPPSGKWLWALSDNETITPDWDGPHCYEIVAGDSYDGGQQLIDLCNLPDTPPSDWFLPDTAGGGGDNPDTSVVIVDSCTNLFPVDPPPDWKEPEDPSWMGPIAVAYHFLAKEQHGWICDPYEQLIYDGWDFSGDCLHIRLALDRYGVAVEDAYVTVCMSDDTSEIHVDELTELPQWVNTFSQPPVSPDSALRTASWELLGRPDACELVSIRWDIFNSKLTYHLVVNSSRFNSEWLVWVDVETGGVVSTQVGSYDFFGNSGDIRPPVSYSLSRNYPNPFNPTTTILFDLPAQSHVRLEIYNALGQRIEVPIDKAMDAGSHVFRWDGRRYASGMYFYRLEAGEFSECRRMLLVK